jgi:hypothetical protein
MSDVARGASASDRQATMYSPTDLYDFVGFSSIEKMLEYGRLLGKNYEGPVNPQTGTHNLHNLHDAHKTLFDEELEARRQRRDKFFPDPVPLPPNPKSTSFGFLLDIDDSTSSFKTTDHNITIPNISLLKPTEKNTILQVSTIIGSQNYHDQLTTNIRWFDFQGDTLRISFTTFRANEEGWGLHCKVHLLLIVFEKDLP